MPNRISAKDVCVIIPVHNRIDYTINCLKSLDKQTKKGFTVVVVDDGSTDKTYEILQKKFPKVKILRGDGNLWWAGSVNLGVKYAFDHEFKYTLLINNDTEQEPAYLEKMIFWAQKKPDSIFNSMVYDLDTKDPFYAGERISDVLSEKRQFIRRLRLGDSILDMSNLLEKIKNNKFSGLIATRRLAGWGVWIPTTVYDKIGLFDSEDFPQEGADFDFTEHAHRAGFSLFCNCDAKLYLHTKDRTGRKYLEDFTLSNFYRHITAVDGGGNIIIRINYMIRNIPFWLWPKCIIGFITILLMYPIRFFMWTIFKKRF